MFIKALLNWYFIQEIYFFYLASKKDSKSKQPSLKYTYIQCVNKATVQATFSHLLCHLMWVVQWVLSLQEHPLLLRAGQSTGQPCWKGAGGNPWKNNKKFGDHRLKLHTTRIIRWLNLRFKSLYVFFYFYEQTVLQSDSIVVHQQESQVQILQIEIWKHHAFWTCHIVTVLCQLFAFTQTGQSHRSEVDGVHRIRPLGHCSNKLEVQNSTNQTTNTAGRKQDHLPDQWRRDGCVC